MGILCALAPKNVFSYFEKICSVPHASGNLEKITELCVSFAEELKLKYELQPCGDLLIFKEGSPGCEMLAPIILQGHMDMVAVKTDECTKDLATEGLTLQTDGEWVWADGTSLGADDGIALAMIFAILQDESLPHPPIEAVLTVNEETGMDGALALAPAHLRGKMLLNLDSEEEGVLTASCAGGVNANCFLPLSCEKISDEIGLRVSVSGLLGGHSGEMIDCGRANAALTLGRVLFAASERFSSLRAAKVEGGRFHNVICPECTADVCLKPEQVDEFEQFIAQMQGVLRGEYRVSDPNITLSCEKVPLGAAWSAADSARAFAVLCAMPNGVMAMSADIPGLVQTSLNLGTIRTEEDGLHFSFLIRSSVPSQKQMLCEKLRAVLQNGTLTLDGDYPAWPYRPESRLRRITQKAYKAVTGKTARISAIHAGLECGIFCEKIPELDAVSIGPDILDIHSVGERLSVASTGRVYQTVLEILRNLTFPESVVQ